MTEQTMYLQGVILNEDTRCTLADLCRLCGVPAEVIHEMVEEGLLTPEGLSPGDWRFTCVAIKRVQTAVRLQHDLRVNLPGCALALDLLEELEELRRLLRVRR
ncbi:MAG: MerR family transcriptional regulator [Desulfobulbus sp.]|uniref:chaperone modulator CbpM n=1 Tax=uncultured Desulfobulbus sp. TaxID=239745 RepID=UPI001B6F6EC2|nr:chaperone modulator CbpM [uncultured Desulfobulbus sp.]MBP7516279.1 MerR family transcriptional regulator [Desulfobulbus sp.]